MKHYKKAGCLLTTAIITLCVLIWIIWGNTKLELNTYTLHPSLLPDAFDGYRIAHISDLHNRQMGRQNQKLLKALCNAEPDMIALTGDLVDSRSTDISVALDFAEEAMQIAPCYYVPGNHEARIEEYAELRQGLIDLGVVVLENTCVTLSKDEENIIIVGVTDPSFHTSYLFGDDETLMQTRLQTLLPSSPGCSLLLSHRPELFPVYAQQEISLVLTGHAHGGQFRFPFIGGLFAPNQGFFPEYDEGVYTSVNTTMVVSRGIGNSLLPIRINNRPEVILIEFAQSP